MLTTAARLALVVTMLALCVTLFAENADAQRIHPDCAKRNFRDPIGCTCALENGGIIQPRRGGTGWRWSSKISGRERVNDAFVQCMRRNGRG
jgi:hypothetical protein